MDNNFTIQNILFAEDDEDFFFLFKSALLSISGHFNLLRTANGVMLLSLIETSIKPDIIFLDINMPFKNGLECLDEIKSNERYRTTRVIICSSSEDKEDIEYCYERGADFYFVKPSGYLSLITQFQSLLSRCCSYTDKRPSLDQFILA